MGIYRVILLQFAMSFIFFESVSQVPYTRYSAPPLKKTTIPINSEFYGIDSNVSKNLKFFKEESKNFQILTFSPVDSPQHNFTCSIDSCFYSISNYVKWYTQSSKFKIKKQIFRWLKDKQSKQLLKLLTRVPVLDKKSLNNLANKISSLQISFDKVILFVYLKKIQLRLNNDKISIFREAMTLAEKIQMPHQRSYAYEFIGDEALMDSEFAYAIQNYILARENIENVKGLNRKSKYIEQGVICEKIASVYGTYRIQDAQTKHSSYLYEALRFYVSGNYNTGIVKLYPKFFEQTSLFDSCYYSTDAQQRNDTRRMLNGLLIILKTWLIERDKNSIPEQKDEISYFLTLTDAFAYEGQFETAKIFAIRALLTSLKFGDLTFVTEAIHKIATIYSYTKNRELSLNYATLAYEINNKNKTYDFYSCFLKGAELNTQFGNDSLSLSYINQVLKDSDLVKNLRPAYANQILRRAYWNKFIIYNFLKPDSAFYFKDASNNIDIKDVEFYSSMVNSELYSISAWLGRSQEKEKSFFDALNRQNMHSITILNENYLYSDSIRKLNALKIEVEKLNRKQDSLKFSDSLTSSGRIANLEKINARKQLQISYLLIIGISLLSLCIFFIIFLKNRIVKRKRKNELNRINYLVQNNIHNFKNDFTTFTNLIYEQDLPKLKEYNTLYGQYIKQTYENWESKKISLQNELDAGNYYFQSKKLRNPKLQLVVGSEIMAPESTIFLQSIFDTLIHNSITHGFLYKEDECTILIDFYIEKSSLLCVVQDNGKPPVSDDSYLKRPQSGLNLLKARIENLHLQLKGKVQAECFTIKSLPNRQGTQVKMIFPYEAV